MFFNMTISHTHIAGNFHLPTIRPPFGVDDIYVIAHDDGTVPNVPFPIIAEARQQLIPVVSLIGMVNDSYESGNPTDFMLRRRGAEIPYHTAVIEYAGIHDIESVETLYRPYIKVASMFYATQIASAFLADALSQQYLSTVIAIMLTNRYFPLYSTERRIELISTLLDTTFDYVEQHYNDSTTLEQLLIIIGGSTVVEERVTKLDNIESFNAIMVNLVKTPHAYYILAGIESISAFGAICANYINNTEYSKTRFVFSAKRLKKYMDTFNNGMTVLITQTNKVIK